MARQRSPRVESLPRFYHLRIELEAITPLVWRRILIGGDVSLRHLHHVIQAAMGWADSHQHEFQVAGTSYGTPDPDPDFASMRKVVDERSVRLDAVLGDAREFRYWYDFGDDWWHRIVVEEARPIAEDEDVPIHGYVAAGERACPPDDSGGLPGYQGFLDAWEKDPKGDVVSEFLDWAGTDFDPARFDRHAANAAIQRLAWNRWG